MMGVEVLRVAQELKVAKTRVQVHKVRTRES